MSICHNTLRLAEQLIARPSVTPDDAGCMDILAEALRPLGFDCEFIESGPDTFRVRNLWAKRPGRSGQTLAFAGHTDVVPVNEDGWTLAYARLMGDPNFIEREFVETFASEEQQGYRQFLCSVSESLGQQRGVVPLGVISVPAGLVYLTRTDQMALEIRHLQLESIVTRDTVLQRELAQKSEDPAAFLDRVWVGMHRHAATLQAASPNAGMHWPPCVRSSLAMEHSGMNLMLTTLELMLSIDPACAAALLRSSTRDRPFRYRTLFPHTFFELACDFPVDSAVFDAIFNKELQRGIDDGVGEEYFLRALRLQHLQAMHAVLQHHLALGLSHDWIERTTKRADASQPFPEGIALVGSYFAKVKADAVLAEMLDELAKPAAGAP